MKTYNKKQARRYKCTAFTPHYTSLNGVPVLAQTQVRPGWECVINYYGPDHAKTVSFTASLRNYTEGNRHNFLVTADAERLSVAVDQEDAWRAEFGDDLERLVQDIQSILDEYAVKLLEANQPLK